MSIPIKPRDIEVPKDDPFKYDLLGRREPAEVLTRLVVNLDEGPCVLAIDAAWGAGKTTFFRMWTQHLRNKEFPVVEVNAWETDFSEEPFVTLSTELIDGIKSGKRHSSRKPQRRSFVGWFQTLFESRHRPFRVPARNWAKGRRPT